MEYMNEHANIPDRLTPENTYTETGAPRQCRECCRARSKAQYLRKKAKGAK